MSTRRSVESRPEMEAEAFPAETPMVDLIPDITETDCEQCGTRIAGLSGRYACGACGWVNHWSQGYTDLPAGPDDLDYRRR